MEIKDINKIITERTPVSTSKNSIVTYVNDNVLQITIKTTGCRFNKSGHCSMCNYGVGVEPDKNKIISELNEVIKDETNKGIREILLGAYGSFLDNEELSIDIQNEVLETVENSEIEHVIIETHYTTVTRENLERIKSILINKKISVEMGFETMDEWQRSSFIYTEIDNNQFKSTMKLAKEFGINSICTVLAGLPMLNIAAQANDTLSAITWLFNNGADHVVICPVNIHPDTFFYNIFRTNEFDPMSLWLVVEILKRVKTKQLKDISLAWFGDRKLVNSNNEETIDIGNCDKCTPTIIEYFKEFNITENSKKKLALLNKLYNIDFGCDCKDFVSYSLRFIPKNDRNLKVKLVNDVIGYLDLGEKSKDSDIDSTGNSGNSQ